MRNLTLHHKTAAAGHTVVPAWRKEGIIPIWEKGKAISQEYAIKLLREAGFGQEIATTYAKDTAWELSFLVAPILTKDAVKAAALRAMTRNAPTAPRTDDH